MARSVKCWGNPIIKVNLTNGKITKEVIPKKVLQKFLLGRGLSDWFLYQDVEPGKTDPLGPDNVIYFGIGMLVGTECPGALRTSVVSLNPLTGGYGESSSAGGFSIEVKNAGYDGIVVCGKSPKPVYLWINDDHVELCDATKLVGKTTFEASDLIKKELKSQDTKTLCIGPAGEKLVRFANINCDNRYAGRCGMGAVMGAKNLKAIAARGTGEIELVDPVRFAAITDNIRELLKNDNVCKFMATYGMAATPEPYNEAGIDGTQNFTGAYFDKMSKIGYDAIKRYYKNVIKCPTDCPVLCDRLVEIDQGDPYGGTWVSSMQATPSYNFAHFLIDDINTVIKGFELCNAYGLDIHSWSNVMQWAIECYERGILLKDDTDNLELRWKDGPLLLESIRRIAYREGKLGNLLAEGVAIASRTIGKGSQEYAMQMKGMEIDDELRVCKGYGLGVLTEIRGPAHTHGAWFGEFDQSMTPEKAKALYGIESAANPHAYEGKADLVVLTERYGAIQDSLGVCLYATQRIAPQIIDKYNMKTYGELIAAAIGWEVSEKELFKIAERILTLEKSINVLAGFRREDDWPPDRFFEPLTDDKFKGMKLDRQEVDKLLKIHDTLHGWDANTGIPTKDTLEALGLEEIAEVLPKE